MVRGSQKNLRVRRKYIAWKAQKEIHMLLMIYAFNFYTDCIYYEKHNFKFNGVRFK